MSVSYSVLPVAARVNMYFDQEMEDWKRIINFMQEENIVLKGRLSAILKNSSNDAVLVMERAEYFHDLFLKEDEVAGFLHNEMKNQQKLRERQAAHTGGLYSVKPSGGMQDKFSNLVLTAVRNFNNVKVEFNNYAAELVQMHVA